MLVFHFNINGMYISCVRNRNTISILINYIPIAFFAIWPNVVVLNVLKNTLIEVPNTIVIRLVFLSKNFMVYAFSQKIFAGSIF